MIMNEKSTLDVMSKIRRTHKSVNEAKIKQKLSFVLLDLIASYVVSDNANIRKKGYTNIENLINLLDREQYQDDAFKNRLLFINLALEARLKYNLTSSEEVVDYINNSQAETLRWDLNLREINNDEVEYVNSTVNGLLDNSAFNQLIKEFNELYNDYEVSSVPRQKIIVDQWKDLVAKANNQIRMNKIEKGDEEYFSLSENFDEYTREVHTDLSNPSTKLATGMFGLNCLLNGGFENGRTYCFFGLQGEGKSVTLLNLAKQIKDFNRFYKPKDRTKKPAVVYLTLENRKKETLTRLISIGTGIDNMEEYEIDEVIKEAKEVGGLVVNDQSPIDIIVKYKPNNSIDTSYLYELYEDLSDRGYEVIAYVVDYLGRLRSIEKYGASEERLKLGSIVNEMKTIAGDLDVPIITASQFNRDASGKIDDARSSNSHKNLVNLLGRQNIAESMLILNNIDAGLMLAPEYINNGTEKYMGIKLAKARYRPNLEPLNRSTVIHQPFTSPTGISLLTDVGGKPMFKLDLADAVELNTNITGGSLVDNKAKIPDNTHRCNLLNEKPVEVKTGKSLAQIAKESKNKKNNIDDQIKMFKDEHGNEIDYNPNWMNEPKTKHVEGYGDYMNIDALPPEQQMRYRQKIREGYGSNVKTKFDPFPNISRYSDEYTYFYDPEGSKEERMIYDYNLLFGRDFKQEDVPYIRNHINRCKFGLADENKFEYYAFGIYNPRDERPNAFIQIPGKMELETIKKVREKKLFG